MANDPTHDYAVQSADRLAIHDCLYRNCLGTDMLDAEIWKSSYWPDADEEHIWYNGNAHRFVDETVVSLRTTMDATWHNMGNMMIEFEGSNRARCVSYFFVYTRIVGPDGARSDSFSGGRYMDRLEKRDGQWKIRYRITKTDWIRLEKDSFAWGSELFPGLVLKLGMRDPDDPARLLLRRESPTAPPAGPGSISPPW